MIPPPLPRHRRREAGVDHDLASAAADQPDEVVERHRPVVRVAADEILRCLAHVMRVLDRVDLVLRGHETAPPRSARSAASGALQSRDAGWRYTGKSGNQGERPSRRSQRHSGGNGTSTRALRPMPASRWMLVLLTLTYSSTNDSTASSARRSSPSAERSWHGAPKPAANSAPSCAR